MITSMSDCLLFLISQDFGEKNIVKKPFIY